MVDRSDSGSGRLGIGVRLLLGKWIKFSVGYEVFCMGENLGDLRKF